jgi:hypothetical protein
VAFNKARNKYCTFKVECTWTNSRDESDDDDYLVGVELNPGPSQFLLSHLKAMDNLPDRAPARKRLDKVSKKYIAMEREKEKRSAILHRAASSKRMVKFVPEGLFTADIGEDTKTFLTNLLEQFKGVLDQGTVLKVDLVSSLTDKIQVLVDWLVRKGGLLYDIVLCVLKIVAKCAASSYKVLISFILKHFLKCEETFESESIADTLQPAFLSLLYREHLSKYIGECDWIGFMKTFTKIKDSKKDATNTVDFLLEVLRSLFEFVRNFVDVETPYFLKSGTKLDSFYTRFYDLRKEYRSTANNSYPFAEAVFALQEDIEAYSKVADISERDKVSYLLSAFKPIVQHCETNVNPNNGPRNYPLGILVCGPTNVGKSLFTMPFLLSLLAAVIEENHLSDFLKNHNDYIFFRANENEFWDGLKSRQFAVVYDDFGQRRDTAGTPNPDAFEIIRMINSAPYHLHFSSIIDKSKNYAHPKVVFATTNLNNVRFQSIISNEAVIRRFHIKVCQVPKKEFCVDPNVTQVWERRLDIDKVRAQYPSNVNDPSTFAVPEILEYVEWDFVRGCPLDGGKTFSYDGLLAHAEKTYIDLNSTGTQMLQYHELVKRSVAKRRGFVPEGYASDDESDSDEVYHDCVERKFFDNVSDILNDRMYRGDADTAREIMKFCGVVLGVIAVYKGCSYLFRNMFAPGAESSGTKGKAVTKRKAKIGTKTGNKIAMRRAAKVASRMGPEGADGAVNSQFEFVVSVLKRNVYMLFIDELDDEDQPTGNKLRLGSVIFLCGTTFCMPVHFESMMFERGSTVMYFCDPFSGMIRFKCDYDNAKVDTMEENETLDLLYVKLPLGVCREHSDIRNAIPDQSKFKEGSRFQCIMPVWRSEMLSFLNPVVNIGQDHEYPVGDEIKKSRALTYSAQTLHSDCGSPLFCLDPRVGRPSIIGFHVAGASSAFFGKACAGVALFHKNMQSDLKLLDAVSDLSISENIPLQSESIEFDGFVPLTKLPQPHVPSTTKIKPSPFHQKLWDVLTEPAALKPFVNSEGERIDPAAIARAKYSHEPSCIDIDTIDEIYPHVRKLVLNKTAEEPWLPRLFSFEEAVKGIDGVPGCEGVNRSSSAGYPYNLEKIKGKAKWFGRDGDIDVNNRNYLEMKSKVEKWITDASNGVRNLNVFVDYLKDERRPKAKVAAGKTRQFMACNIELLIAFKMYFGDFIRSIYHNRIYNGVAVGVDPVSEWPQLAAYLQSVHKVKFTAGDYSAFDAKIPMYIGYKILDVIESFYVDSTAEHRRVRRVLFLEIVNSMHLSNGVLYEFVGGNPSGNPMTAIYNSIANIFLIYACGWRCYKDLNPDIEHIDEILLKLFKNTTVTTYGDDNIVGYAPEFKPYFEQSVLTEYMLKMFGYEYTNEAKDSNLVSDRDLTECTFLKRAFRKEGHKVYAPLDISVLRETLNWCKGSDIAEFQLRIEAVLAELSLHGREVFEEHAPKICSLALSEMNFLPENSKFKDAIVSSRSLAVNH